MESLKRHQGILTLAVFVVLCAAVALLTLKATAQYPALGEPVSYPVNQVEGFSLSLEKPGWSPFRGYTLRYDVLADSEDIYIFEEDASSFEYLERLENGRWYRLDCQNPGTGHIRFDLGGDSTGLSGSLVQKYAGYGTRLEPGTYRLALEMRDSQGALHYLAAEFCIP